MRRPLGRRAGQQAGFTLLELMVVLGIFALVLALVFVARPRTAGLRVEAVARALAGSMQRARAAAMTGNVETVFLMDTLQRRYGTGEATHALPMGVDIDIKIAEPERNGTTGGVRFYPDGQSSGGDITVSLDGVSARIAVNWLTGRATLVAAGEP